MRRHRWQSEAAQQALERRQREDNAPRLCNEVPRLKALELEFEEYQSDGGTLTSRHTRHVVIANAPALFEVPCREAKCRDGGHDITRDVLRALRAGEAAFEGDDACNGQLGPSPCQRLLKFTARAEYSDD